MVDFEPDLFILAMQGYDVSAETRFGHGRDDRAGWSAELDLFLVARDLVAAFVNEAVVI